ncbi:hypothetical protein SAMN05421505_105168 [Sinosporangium album]|uniref:Uncharacterized protein n=1 Tax=Sinosporangium album TaxID=504805 RepID=A0A1G7V8B8_9ACTN|nr:hypothetical protein SAMN05421505_105168 [Sinosporangium album]
MLRPETSIDSGMRLLVMVEVGKGGIVSRHDEMLSGP